MTRCTKHMQKAHNSDTSIFEYAIKISFIIPTESNSTDDHRSPAK